MLEIIENYEDGTKDNDYCSSLNIIMKLDEKVILRFNFHDGEPEDNNMSRNFNDVHSIIDAIQVAYEAGKNGDKISFDFE